MITSNIRSVHTSLCECNKQGIANQICVIIQSQIFQHIYTGSNEGSWIRNIFASYFRATASCSLKITQTAKLRS